jgi:hypothetical protein
MDRVETDEFESRLDWPDFRRLYAYWHARCVGGRLPGRSDFDPLELAALLPRLYLVDVIRDDAGSLDFRFRLAGTEHFEINQFEITGRSIAEVFAPSRVAGIRAAYEEIVTTRRPSITRRATAAVSNREHILYDRLLLPLASDGTTVDMIAGYLQRLPPRA